MAHSHESTPAAPSGGGWGFRLAVAALLLMAATPIYLKVCQSFAVSPSQAQTAQGEGVETEPEAETEATTRVEIRSRTDDRSVGTQKLTTVASGGSSDAATNVATVARIFRDSQWTILVVVLGLTILSTRRLYPVLWRVVHSSMANHSLMLGVIFLLWLVHGGLSSMGMPGLFWNAAPRDEFMAAMGAALFVFWMLYLLFVSDFERHHSDSKARLWRQFEPVLRDFLPPGLAARLPKRPSAAHRMSLFLFLSAFPILMILAIPAVLPSLRSGDFQTIVAAEWLLGLAAGIIAAWVVIITRIPTRLNELRRQILRGRLDLRQLWALDPEQLDPEGNAKNILIIVGLLYFFAWLFPKATQALFPPAFSLCILLGVLLTLVVWLGMRRNWRSRLIAAGVALCLIAATGMLDYDVVIRDLAGKFPGAPNLYATPGEQYRYHISMSSSRPRSYGKVVDLTKFQRTQDPSKAGPADFQAREAILDRWKAAMAKRGEPEPAGKPILVVVTTSGGALRAGIWTQAVLRKLDETFPGFHRHVRLITGASGGMFGAARYVAKHWESPANAVFKGHEEHPDFLGPIAWQIAFRDFLPNALMPFPLYNRGDALEDAWTDYAPELKLTFGQLAERELAGEIPSIVFSPMLVEDGRRILIGNLPMADLTVHLNGVLLNEDRQAILEKYLETHPKTPDGRPKTPADVHDYDLEYPALSSFSSLEFAKLFKESRAMDHLRLASAVRMSATFPFITSVVTIPTFPARHVVDAGYYDNYGVNLASSWINSHRRWIRDNAAGVLVVQIRAFRNEKRLKILDQDVYTPLEPATTNSDKIYNWIAWGVGLVPQFLSMLNEGARSVIIPAQGIAMARESSMFFRNDENLEVLNDVLFRMTDDPEFFRTVVFTCDTIQVGQSSQHVETLNWYIDPIEFEQIEENMEPLNRVKQTGRERNHLRLKRLKEWWLSRGGSVAGGT